VKVEESSGACDETKNAIRATTALHFNDASGLFRIHATTLSLRLALAFTLIVLQLNSLHTRRQWVRSFLTFITETLPHLYD